MKFQIKHSSLIVALVITLGAALYCCVVLKNFSQVHHVSTHTFEGEGAEQKGSVQEVADVFLISPQVVNNFKSSLTIQKGLIFDEFSYYAHFGSPETPPPNCFG